MKLQAIDQPFRITKGFLVTWALLLVVGLLFSIRVDVGPWYSELGFLLFVPFLLTFAVFGPVSFWKAVLISGSRGRQVLLALVVVLALVGISIGVLLWSGQYTEKRARFAVLGIVPLANVYLAWSLRRPGTAEPTAAPNGGPATQLGNSRASGGSPSVNVR
jgi:hypothetical protein